MNVANAVAFKSKSVTARKRSPTKTFDKNTDLPSSDFLRTGEQTRPLSRDVAQMQTILTNQIGKQQNQATPVVEVKEIVDAIERKQELIQEQRKTKEIIDKDNYEFLMKLIQLSDMVANPKSLKQNESKSPKVGQATIGEDLWQPLPQHEAMLRGSYIKQNPESLRHSTSHKVIPSVS